MAARQLACISLSPSAAEGDLCGVVDLFRWSDRRYETTAEPARHDIDALATDGFKKGESSGVPTLAQFPAHSELEVNTAPMVRESARSGLGGLPTARLAGFPRQRPRRGRRCLRAWGGEPE